MALEVVQLLSSPNRGYTYLEIKDRWSHDNRVWMDAGDGNLYANQVVGGVHTNFLAIPYDPSAHRWWRIRESGARTFFETSPDGCGWTTRYSLANPITLDAVMIGLGAGTYEEMDAGVALFDNLNIPPMRVPIPGRSGNAFDVRVKAAQIARDRGQPQHANNGEECDYPFVANYSKGLLHDDFGDVVPASYNSLLHALTTREPTTSRTSSWGTTRRTRRSSPTRRQGWPSTWRGRTRTP